MNGHIKIHRKIMDWEWWDDLPVFKLWITILLLANWEDKEWQGKRIPRGSFWTSYANLAKASKLSYKQVRTALCKLERAGDVAVKRAHDGTLITVVKYEDYQTKPRKKGTQKGTQLGTKRATTEEYKEEKKKIWGEGGIIREYI